MNLLKKLFNKLQRPETEAIIWIVALVYLLLVNPYQTQHYSFCVFKLAGFNHCPGCGLGRSIAFIYHGDFLNSIKSHPLGIFALSMILYRIVTLLSRSTIFNKLKLGGKSG